MVKRKNNFVSLLNNNNNNNNNNKCVNMENEVNKNIHVAVIMISKSKLRKHDNL